MNTITKLDVMKRLNEFIDIDRHIATQLIKTKIFISRDFLDSYDIRVNRIRETGQYYTSFIDMLNFLLSDSDGEIRAEINENGILKQFILDFS
jgi:hypothetical protein